MANLKSLVKIKDDYNEKIKKEGTEAIKDSLRGLFETHENLEAVRWTQYTPHFNDGDPCTFSVHEPDIKMEGMNDFVESWEMDESKHEDLMKSVDGLYEDLCKVEDAMQAVFGDGVQVIVSRNKNDIQVEIEDYDHD